MGTPHVRSNGKLKIRRAPPESTRAAPEVPAARRRGGLPRRRVHNEVIQGGEPPRHPVGDSGPLGCYIRYRSPRAARRGKPGVTNGSTRGESKSLSRLSASTPNVW